MQAVFAAMEEEHEAHINFKDVLLQSEERGKEEGGKEEGGKEEEGGREEEGGKEEEGGREEEGGETEGEKKLMDDREEGAELEEKLKEEVEEKEEGGGEKEGEGGGEEEEEEEKPLDMQVESIRASAVTFAQWPQQTQRLPLHELVVDCYTCSEVLRLHLLASTGYADTGERKLFRCHRRGGYSDGDDPAIALRLRRPDLLDSLRRVSIYDFPPGDKLELLSTLCSQLLSYSVAREYIEECTVRGKRARRRIRELLHFEEKRKREAKQQRAKERREKEKTAPKTAKLDSTQSRYSVVYSWGCCVVAGAAVW